MKKWLSVILLSLILFVNGCSMVAYKDFLYIRVGEQKIGLLKIKTEEVEATLEDQKASADELVKALADLRPGALQKILAILAGI